MVHSSSDLGAWSTPKARGVWIRPKKPISQGHPRISSRTKQGKNRTITDVVLLKVAGGRGGSGCVSFHQNRKGKGVPTGGHGGTGGRVFVQADETVASLSGADLTSVSASPGAHGSSNRMNGARGEDVVVSVPVGTMVYVERQEDAQHESPSIQSLLSSQHPSLGVIPSSSSTSSTTTKGTQDAYVVPQHAWEEIYLGDDDDGDDGGTISMMDTSTLFESSGDAHQRGKPIGRLGATMVEKAHLTCLGDLMNHEQQVLVASGGTGGKGNSATGNRGKRKRLRVPSIIRLDEDGDDDEDDDDANHRGAGGDNFHHHDGEDVPNGGAHDDEILRDLKGGIGLAYPGSAGEQHTIILEHRSISDIGLVGFPNAGKSTLLAAVTNANPLIAPYAFTTMSPNLGMLEYDDYTQITVADIPGIIEGAHDNRGLGLGFLRHIARSSILCYVLDMSQPHMERPVQQMNALLYELEHYMEGIITRPSVVVANKMDHPNAQANFEFFASHFKNISLPMFPVSLKNDVDALEPLVDTLYDLYGTLPSKSGRGMV